MTGLLEASGFVGRWAFVNSMSVVEASHLDITRSLLSVGYQSRSIAAATVGRWRIRLLHALMEGYLDRSLRTTYYFGQLEQSEKAAMTFLIGSAFAQWFGQARMGLLFLVHVKGTPGFYCHPAAGTGASKPGASLIPNGARPDFIGFRPGEYHIFESKGRQRRPAQKAISNALGQAASIVTVNGQAPETRVAAFAVLKGSGLEAIVIDPPLTENSVQLEFSDLEAIRKAYAFFLGPEFQGREGVVEGFSTTMIDEGVYYGVDAKLLRLLQQFDDQQSHNVAEDALTYLAEWRHAYGREGEVGLSVGPDGTILLDRR